MSDIQTRPTSRDRGGDERIARRVAEAQRKREAASPDVVEARKRIQAFRDRWQNNVMPEIPDNLVPGYHVCWGTTQSKGDTIEGRLQLGYTLVQESEINPDSGFVAQTKMSAGKYEGAISCNELILLKIPIDFYQEIMTMMHHEDPLEYQRNITDEVRAVADQYRGGHSLVEGGYLEMEKEARRVGSRPTFN